MQKNIIIATCILFATIGTITNNVKAESLDQPDGNHTFEASINHFHFDYKEILTPPAKSTEEEWLTGIHLVYSYKKPEENEPISYRIMVDYADGETYYDGSTFDGTPLVGTTDNSFFTGEVNIGYTFQGYLNVTAYSGIGYRNWKRGDIGGPGSYSEIYSWGYLPVGVRTDYRLTEKLTGALDISAHYMLNGKIKVLFSEYDPDYNDGKASLGNKMGWKVEAPLQYRISRQWSFIATPWYEYTKIGRGSDFLLTDGVTPFIAYEPASKTKQYGVNIGFKAHF
ncbi:MAG TPA: hypothetical protein DCX54_11125 [Flavobacteriales bacterium]|nr:hypothetical protein [Flavobacteriales bacterium]